MVVGWLAGFCASFACFGLGLVCSGCFAFVCMHVFKLKIESSHIEYIPTIVPLPQSSQLPLLLPLSTDPLLPPISPFPRDNKQT